MRSTSRSRWRAALGTVSLVALAPVLVLLLAVMVFVGRAALFGLALIAVAAGLVVYPASPRLRAWVGEWAGAEGRHAR